MEKIIINPENYTEQYIQSLNQCFNNWGGDKEYNWIFNRTLGKKTSDIIVIKDEKNDAIAGSGVTYRRLIIDNKKTINIGIMTGSWTLPKARGKGCFSKIIEISKNICNQNDIPFLTAFVMESNPSYRRLKNAGSILMPTYHFISKETFPANKTNVLVISNKLKASIDIYDRVKENLSFYYTYENFYQQYINRILNVEILKIENNYIIIEETENIIKVLLITYNNKIEFENIITTLTTWGLEKKCKQILLFTTIKEIAELLDNLGFDNLSSYFTILNTSKELSNNKEIEQLHRRININLGDKT